MRIPAWHRIARGFRFLPAVVFVLVSVRMATAAPVDELAFRVGGFVTRFDTTIRHDANPADSFDFDRELGLEDQTLIESVTASWLPWRHHEFGIEYFNEELSGTRRLGREVEFDDTVFPLATTVHSSFAIEALEFHYTWWAKMEEEWALGLRLGFVDYRMRMHIRMLLGEEGEPPDVRLEAWWDDHVPAPTLGFDFRIVPSERWRINGNVGWFEADFKTVSPIIATARFGVEFFPWENLGVWADYGLSRLDARIHSSSFDGQVEIYEGGLRLGVVWRM